MFTSIFLFGSIIIGIILAEILKDKLEKYIHYLVTFSGSYLLAISLLHILPELLNHTSINFNTIGMYILIGFFIQIILEFFSKGFEHGHNHKEKNISFTMIISLYLHAILEGMPLGGHLETHAHNSLLSGIILHKIPIAIVMITFLIKNKVNKLTIYSLLLLFGLMSPLGAYLSTIPVLANYTDYITSIVVGILIYLSTTIIIESSKEHKITKENIILIISSLILAAIT